MSYIDLGSIGYDLTLKKDSSWTGGMASAEGDLQKLGAAMSYNQKELDGLQKEIFNTSSRMRELRDQGKENTDEYTKESAKLDKLQEDYKKVEAATKGFKDELDKLKTQSGETFTKLGSDLDKAGTAMKGAGQNMTQYVTLPLLGIAAASVTVGIKFESAFAEVKKSVGGTSEELESLRGEILKSSETTPVSADAIAAVYAMGGQLGVATEDLKGFSDTALGLSVATNMSLDEGASQVAKFANIMGTTVKEGVEGYEKLGSTLVALGNNGASTEADIMAMGLRIAGSAKQVGMSEAQTLAFANALSSVGIEAEAGGSAVSKTMSNIDKDLALNNANAARWAQLAGKSTEEFKAAWKDNAAVAMADVFKGMGEVEAKGGNLNLVLDDLGVTEIRQGDMMKRLSGASDILSGSLQTGNEAWDKNAALQKEVDARYSTTESKMTMLANRAKLAGMDLSEALIPVLTRIMDVVDKVISWFRNLDSSQQKVVLTVLALVAAIGPLLMIIGSLVSFLGSIVTICGAVAGAGGFAAVAAAALPVIGIVAGVIAAIVAIAAVGYLIYKHWDDIKAFFVKTWNDIKEGASKLWTGVTEAFEKGWAAVKTGFASIGTWFINTWNSIKSLFSNAVTAVGQVVNDKFGWLFDGVKLIFAHIGMFFEGWWIVVKNLFLGPILLIIDLCTGNFGKLKTDFEQIWGNIREGVGQMWVAITGIFTTFIGLIVTAITNWWNNVIGVFNMLKDALPAIWEAIKTFAVDAWNRMKDSVVNAVVNLYNSVVEKFNNLVTWVSELPGKLSDFFTSLPEKMKTIGKQIVDGLREGIENAWAAVIKKVGDLAGGIADKIRDVLGIHSPSTVAVGLMEDGVGEGLVGGLMNSVRKVKAAAGNIVGGIKDTLAGATGTIGLDMTVGSKGLALAGASGSVTYDFRNARFNIGADAMTTPTVSGFVQDLQRLSRMG